MVAQEVLSYAEAGVEPQKVARVIRNSFQFHREGPQGYGIDRKAFGLDYATAYEPNLPPFYESNEDYYRVDFKKSIEIAIERNGKAEVLDIGCGENNFARSLKKKYGGKVNVTGITAFDYRSGKQKQIDVKQGNVLKIADIQQQIQDLPEGYFDCSVSVKALLHTAHPLGVMKEMYRLTKTGGYGFLNIESDYLKLHFRKDEDYEKLINYLKKRYKFQQDWKGLAGLSFKKTSPYLYLPVDYQDIVKIDGMDNLRYRCLI